MKRTTWMCSTGLALAFGVSGCMADEDIGSAQEELMWCYAVPVDLVMEDASAEEAARLGSVAPVEKGIYCGLERPAEASGDALLPVFVDREARSLRLEGGLDIENGGIVVVIDDLEPGTWTEHKKVYNLSKESWYGWQVTMGNAALVVPESANNAQAQWIEVDSDVAAAVAPFGYRASVNAEHNAVYFGDTLGPSPSAQQAVAPGEHIEKVWSYVVESAAGKATGNARMCHNRPI